MKFTKKFQILDSLLETTQHLKLCFVDNPCFQNLDNAHNGRKTKLEFRISTHLFFPPSQNSEITWMKFTTLKMHEALSTEKKLQVRVRSTQTLTPNPDTRAFLKNVFPEFKVKFLKQSFPLCLGSF